MAVSFDFLKQVFEFPGSKSGHIAHAYCDSALWIANQFKIKSTLTPVARRSVIIHFRFRNLVLRQESNPACLAFYFSAFIDNFNVLL